MLPGLNHNLRHNGVLFHVQTEDCGLKNPVVVTHIFHGGTILATRRRSYQRFVKAPGFKEVVETMMREQHKEMMKDLINERFQAVREILEGEPPTAKPSPPPEGQPPVTELKPEEVIRPAAAQPASLEPQPELPPEAELVEPEAEEGERATLDSGSYADQTLDELILDFLEQEQKKDK